MARCVPRLGMRRRLSRSYREPSVRRADRLAAWNARCAMMRISGDYGFVMTLLTNSHVCAFGGRPFLVDIAPHNWSQFTVFPFFDDNEF